MIKTFCYSLENQLHFITQDLDDKDYFTRPDQKTPAIGWFLAHILVSHDFIVNHSMLGNKLFLPEDIIKNYNTGSSGKVVGSMNPTNILQEFKDLNKTVVEDLLKKDDQWLEDYPVQTKDFPKNWLNKNNMKVFVLYFNHAMNHSGQILEVKRRLGKKVWGV